MMKFFSIDNYDIQTPTNKGNNYIIYSDLPKGKMQVSSPKISTKMLLKGSEIYATSKKSFPIEQGQFLLAAPDEPLDLTIKSSAIGYCFYFELAYVNRLITELLSVDLEGGNNNIVEIKTIRLPIEGSQLGIYMKYIAKNTLKPDSNLLTSFLAEHAVHLFLLNKKLPYQRESTRTELISRLEVARTYLMDMRKKNISLSDLEKASCLSRYHLNRSFACLYGTPPLRFHQNLKLDMARKRLKEGVTQEVIARELGFSTTSSFSRAYRRRHHCSPSIDQSK